ncbi:MAG: DUF3189 family protein [Peptococcaceae bacterium]|nr:DUF3189 family protein [Peptococcaceae bacterium]
MKTVILYNSFNFPLSLVAGAILTGKLPDRYTADKIWDVLAVYNGEEHREGKVCYLGTCADGSKVAVLYARSGKIILRNLITSFLEINHIPQKEYSILEINPPPDLSFLLGRHLMGIPLLGAAGKRLVERYLARIYPELVKTVKLDCHCQISDN